MVQQKKLLLLGYGDIAACCASGFVRDGHLVTAVARSEKNIIPGLTFWQGAMASDSVKTKLAHHYFDTVIVTLTPDRYDDAGYRQAYVENARHLVDFWDGRDNAPSHVLFVSSTSVYGQHAGEWVDERSPTEPKSYAGRRVLEAEAIFAASSLNTTIVRFSGIYSKDRDFLVRQVREKKAGNSSYTNRIHRDDCVGVLSHLASKYWRGEALDAVYLASDSMPVSSKEIRLWLAERLHIDPDSLQAPQNGSGRTGNKQCDNRRLLQSGYHFIHPTYQSGYQHIA